MWPVLWQRKYPLVLLKSVLLCTVLASMQFLLPLLLAFVCLHPTEWSQPVAYLVVSRLLQG